MFDKRTFMLGVGTGIIIGALLLQLINVGQSGQEKLQGLSDEMDSVEMNETALSEPSMSTEPLEVENNEVKDPVIDEEEQGQAVMVFIESGSKLIDAAETLQLNAVISDPEAFVEEMLVLRKPVGAGYFLFQPSMTLAEVINMVTAPPLSDEQVQQFLSNQ